MIFGSTTTTEHRTTARVTARRMISEGGTEEYSLVPRAIFSVTLDSESSPSALIRTFVIVNNNVDPGLTSGGS